MNWIFYTLLVANLAYSALNLWGQRANTVSTAENIGNTSLINSSSGASGFGQKSDKILVLSETSHPRDKLPVDRVLEQPKLAADKLKSCVGLGPFGNVISVQGVAERLKAIGYNVDISFVDSRNGEADFRVVMPPLSSRQEAFRRHRELKSRGIESFVITKGLDARGISLGVFSSHGPAEDYRQVLIGLGYEVLLNVLPRVSRGYWIQIDQKIFPVELLSEVAAKFIDVEVAETDCMN